jgi:hypothetical protein
MMTPHHVFLYSLDEENNRCITIKIHPNGENCTRRCMNETHDLPESSDRAGFYEIRLEGHLDDRWADRFEGQTITLEENGNTLLTGRVVDQAALHGLLKRIRDLGMILVSVGPVEPGPSDA